MLNIVVAPRSRPWLAVAFVAVIVLGLSSRRFPSMFPALLDKYPGDAFWALMVFVGLAFAAPRATTLRLAVAAFGIACCVELSQLYQAPWINAVRGTVLGHLVLGRSFSWGDIAAYAAGVAIGALLDLVGLSARGKALRRTSSSGGQPLYAAHVERESR